MKISIERNDRMYTVTVGEEPIVTLWAWTDKEVKEFIHQVRRIHGKRNTQDLIVGLWADHSGNNYSGGWNYFYNRCKKGGDGNRPLEVMALCAGHHCLLIELQSDCKERKVLRDFLHDRKTVVVGVGIERLAKKLEEDNGIFIPRRVELRRLAQSQVEAEAERVEDAAEKVLKLEKCSFGELGRMVLGEEVDYVRPTKIRWRENQPNWGQFSNCLVKCSTAEAFLAAQIGAKLLK